MSTHDKVMIEARPLSKLTGGVQDHDNYDVIGIDEGQFFPDLIEFCDEMANKGKTIVIAALDGDFQRKPFGRVLELVPKAESVQKLNAVCQLCYADAPFTKRTTSDTAVEVI